jgi:hypothetical protein
MRLCVFVLLIAGCGPADAPDAPPGEPIGQAREQASPPAPTPSASAIATALAVSCEPCNMTDPLCDCMDGRREAWSPPKLNPSASAMAGAAPAPPLAITPFRIITKRESLRLVVEVDASGQLALTSGEKGGGARRMGKIEGADIFDPGGVRVAQLSSDGTLAIADGERLRLDASNEIITATGGRVSIANDGTVHAVLADGKPIPGFSARVEGFKPEMRRTAIVVFVSFFGVR